MPALLDKGALREPADAHKSYNSWCREKVRKYPTILDHHFNDSDEPINPYEFVHRLFAALPRNCNVVTGDGTAAVVTFKAANIGANQRVFTNKGCASWASTYLR